MVWPEGRTRRIAVANDIYASIKELTQPKSGGQPSNPHAVSARKKLEPNFERMRQLTQGNPNDRDREASVA